MFGLYANQILFILAAVGVNLLFSVFFILFLCLDPARQPGTFERWLVGQNQQARDYPFLPAMYPPPRDLEMGRESEQTTRRVSEQRDGSREQAPEVKEEKGDKMDQEKEKKQNATEVTPEPEVPAQAKPREMSDEQWLGGYTRTPVHPLIYSNLTYSMPQVDPWGSTKVGSVLGDEMEAASRVSREERRERREKRRERLEERRERRRERHGLSRNNATGPGIGNSEGGASGKVDEKVEVGLEPIVDIDDIGMVRRMARPQKKFEMQTVNGVVVERGNLGEKDRKKDE